MSKYGYILEAAILIQVDYGCEIKKSEEYILKKFSGFVLLTPQEIKETSGGFNCPSKAAFQKHYKSLKTKEQKRKYIVQVYENGCKAY